MFFGKKKGLLAAGIMFFVSLHGVSALAACVGVVNADNVNLRNANSTSGEVLTRLSKGQSVSVKGEKGGWYQISVDDKSGYVRADMLDLGSSGSTLYVAKADINLRESANTSCNVVKTLAVGQTVEVKGVSGDWYQVSVDGDSGYIRSDLLTSSKPKEAAADSEEIALQDVAEGGQVVDAGDMLTAVATDGMDAVTDDAAIIDENVDDGFDISEDILDLVDEGEPAPTSEEVRLNNQEMQQALKDLGFYRGEVDGNFGTVSSAALMAFQRAYGLEVDGKAGAVTYTTAATAVTSGGNGSHAGQVQLSSNGVILAEWFNYMKPNFPKYVGLRCVDVETGAEFYLRAFSAGNHADVETLTKEDTQILYEINGNKWSWDPRPIWVYIDGQCYAAVINVQPHGGDTLPENGMSGQICMHFLHSRNHNTGRENKNMQAGVLEAFEKAEQAPAAQASDYLTPPDLPEE